MNSLLDINVEKKHYLKLLFDECGFIINDQYSTIFTVRRHAKRGICRHRVRLCVCVRHTPVLYRLLSYLRSE